MSWDLRQSWQMLLEVFGRHSREYIDLEDLVKQSDPRLH